MNVSGGADTDGLNFIFVYEDNTTQVLRVHGETLSHYSMVSNASKTLKALRFSYNTNVDAKLKNIQFEYGSTATAYEPYAGTAVPLQLPQPMRSLPDGTKDTLALTYLRPSTREGWAWYAGEVTRETGQTTQAATDGITGTVGVDVLSTTGEITDGPTVVYKLPTPTTETLGPIELPVLPAPNLTIWATADATPPLQVTYERDVSIAIAALEAAIADIATS
jgi:hypothetical protein